MSAVASLLASLATELERAAAIAEVGGPRPNAEQEVELSRAIASARAITCVIAKQSGADHVAEDIAKKLGVIR